MITAIAPRSGWTFIHPTQEELDHTASVIAKRAAAIERHTIEIRTPRTKGNLAKIVKAIDGVIAKPTDSRAKTQATRAVDAALKDLISELTKPRLIGKTIRAVFESDDTKTQERVRREELLTQLRGDIDRVTSVRDFLRGNCCEAIRSNLILSLTGARNKLARLIGKE